ncbi:MAG: HAMP domain-containing sensor histidine kinase [Oscillospiraceae bacterium]
MSKTAQTSSTTKRLRNLQQKRIRTALFFSGAVAIILLVLGFCYVNDSAYSGEYNPFSLWSTVSRKLGFEWGENIPLPRVDYIISTEGKIPATIDVTVSFYTTVLGIALVGISNLFISLFSSLFAKRQIRKQLEPLYQLAKSALRLSDESFTPEPQQAPQGTEGYDPRQIHDLESAIDNIRPEQPNAALHTGDNDLKGLESAINSLLARTRASYSQQTRFVSDASHELRTPIAVIKGYTDLLDRWGKEDEKILQESISAIKSETEHMNRLVEQLLFLARGDSGRTKLNIEPFSLSDMLREVYAESVMIDTEHEWELRASDEIAAMGDTAMLKQATRILVDNAVKYTPQGETIMLKAILDPKGAPTIVVQDSGIGIAERDVSHVFDRFYRSDPARVRQQGGTGLGLSIAKWIVDRHNGYLEVISREEIGTRVSIHLPPVTA